MSAWPCPDGISYQGVQCSISRILMIQISAGCKAIRVGIVWGQRLNGKTCFKALATVSSRRILLACCFKLQVVHIGVATPSEALDLRRQSVRFLLQGHPKRDLEFVDTFISVAEGMGQQQKLDARACQLPRMRLVFPVPRPRLLQRLKHADSSTGHIQNAKSQVRSRSCANALDGGSLGCAVWIALQNFERW